MTETAGSPFGVVQHFHRLPDDLAVSRDHHLADTLPVIDGKRFGREVYQDYADYRGEIGIILINLSSEPEERFIKIMPISPR